MKGIKHIFFDLDHTLWDYDFNSRKVLQEVYDRFGLSEVVPVTAQEFIRTFYQVNASLWRRYNVGEIDRDQIRHNRFEKVIVMCGGSSHNGLSGEISQYFLYQCPRQPKIIEGADIALHYLSKRYGLSVVTNGFDDVQGVKLKCSRLDGYFSHVFTSETTGYKKPAPEIFYHAMDQLGLNNTEVLMVGDNPGTDILGAQNAGITPLLYNPAGRVKSSCELQISDLTELMKML